MKFIHYILCFFCFIPLCSIAGVYVEPYGGVGGAFSSSVSKSSRSFFMKYTAGGRLGYQLPFVSLGMDIFWTYYDTEVDPDVVTVRPSQKTRGFQQAVGSSEIEFTEKRTPFKPLSIGIFTAVELPIFFNAYGSLFYAFGDKDDISYGRYGLKAGVSWLSTDYFQINLETQWAYYTCKLSQCSNFSILSALLFVSVPFSFDLFADTSDSPSESKKPADTEESEEV